MKRILFLLLLLLIIAPCSAEEPNLGAPIDPALGEVPYRYARVNTAENETAGMYYDLASAIKGEDPVLTLEYGNMRYISYTNSAAEDGAFYAQSKSGLWMRCSPGYTAHAPYGREFTGTPSDLGWVVREAALSRWAGTLPEENAQSVRRGAVFPIYEETELYGTVWYRVGTDQWIDGGSIRVIQWDELPEITEEGRVVLIDLDQQVLMLFEDGAPVYASLIASGAEDFTRPGKWRIESKLSSEDMTGALRADRSDYFYLEDVPFTMYFDEERAIHGIYWPAQLGFKQSHGCINMTIADAHWLYNRLEVGDTVLISEEQTAVSSHS